VKRIAAVVVLSSLALAGCGGGSSGSTGPSAYSLANRACQSSGPTAAQLAQQAAALDPRYAQLAADEQALAANIAAQRAGTTDDQDITGIAGEQGTGTGSSAQVLADCANLARSLIPGQQ
jgi:hypothetical protein